MRALTQREKRTVRIAGIGIAIYLVLFFGAGAWRRFDQGRRDYLQLVRDARLLRRQLQPYEDKALAAQRLMAHFHFDPAKLTNATLVIEASAAIQRAAMSGGIQLGPIRETSSRASNKELAQMQLEGTGPASAVLALLSRLENIGYPLVIDSVQLNTDNSRPGNVKVALTIVILDFDQWQKGGTPDA
jgi:hypothetical protein